MDRSAPETVGAGGLIQGSRSSSPLTWLLASASPRPRQTERGLRRTESKPSTRQDHRSGRQRLTSWRLLPPGANLKKTLGPLHGRDASQPLNRLPDSSGATRGILADCRLVFIVSKTEIANSRS